MPVQLQWQHTQFNVYKNSLLRSGNKRSDTQTGGIVARLYLITQWNYEEYTGMVRIREAGTLHKQREREIATS